MILHGREYPLEVAPPPKLILDLLNHYLLIFGYPLRIGARPERLASAIEIHVPLVAVGPPVNI